MDLAATLTLPEPAPQAAARAGQARAGAADPSTDPVREAAREFETLVLGLMLEPMFAGLRTDGPFGGGQSETIFRSMLVQEYAKSVTAKGGIGLTDAVHRELLKLQEMR